MNLASRVVCAGCGTLAPDAGALPARCLASGSGDDVDHVLVRELDLTGCRFPFDGDESPLVRYRELLHAYRAARRQGVSDEQWVARARELDQRLGEVGRGGFRSTPLDERPTLAAALGAGSLWIKDETAGVGGTHKARHLAPLALHRWVTQPDRRPRLAVASCGNAALAAALLARALDWPLEAHVPVQIAPAVAERLRELGVRLVPCERDGSPGDPCQRSLLSAVAEGAVPFSCQGSANGLAIEGGATLVWEVVARDGDQAAPIDNVIVQVGGGALASAVSLGFHDAQALGAITRRPRLFCVQGDGCAPLAGAWGRLAAQGALNPEGMTGAVRRRSQVMLPWTPAPSGLAEGLLDDETYDWAALVRGMLESGGRPLVVSDEELRRAGGLAQEHTGIEVDASGAAGLAGWARLCQEGVIGADERSLVLFTGARQ